MAGAGYQGVVAAYGDIQKALGNCQKVLEVPAERRIGNHWRTSIFVRPEIAW